MRCLPWISGGGGILLLYSLALASSFGLSFWLDGTDPLEAVLLTLLYCMVAFALLRPLARFVSRHGEPWKDGVFDKRLFLTVLGAIFLVYFFQFLINFPGCCTPDSSDSIKTALGLMELSNWTPIFYTLFVAPFVLFGQMVGDLTWGIALYSFVQMTLFALVLAYAVAWLARRGAPRILVVFAILFFVLDPVAARYSITMWKDIPFSLCMFLYLLCLTDIVLARGRIDAKMVIKLVVLSLGVGLFRNNGLYIVFLTLIVLTLAYRKVSLARFLPVALGVPMVILIVTGPIYAAAGVAPSPFRESIAIPLQQVGAVIYHDGDMTEEQRDFLSGFMSTENVKSDYTTTSSDGLKFGGHFNDEWMEENKVAFMKTWLDLGLQNPLLYFEAWLSSTEGYWNIDTSGWAVASSGYFGEPGTSILYEITGMESLNRDGDEDFQELRFTHFPTYALYNIATSVWMLFGCALLALRHRRALVVPLVPLFAMWLTMMMAAPEYCQYRYMFALHLAIPFMAALAFAAYNPLSDKDASSSARNRGGGLPHARDRRG